MSWEANMILSRFAAIKDVNLLFHLLSIIVIMVVWSVDHVMHNLTLLCNFMIELPCSEKE